jgi:adenylate cyclase
MLFSDWNKAAPRILVALIPLVLLLIHASGAKTFPILTRLDSLYYDTRLQLTMPRTRDDRVVIVDIDERSLAEVGRFPWSRNLVAKLVDEMVVRQQATVVGFDIAFIEPDNSSGLSQLQALAGGELKDTPGFAEKIAAIAPSLNYDALLAASLKGKPVVLGYYFTSDRDGRKSGKLPIAAMRADLVAGRAVPFTEWDGYGANLPLLNDAAASAGFFNSYTDTDGVVRRTPLVAKHAGQYYESLALAVFRVMLGQPRIEPIFPEEKLISKGYLGLEAIQLRSEKEERIRIPVDINVAATVPYRGKGGPAGGSYRYVSAADLLQGKLDPASFKDKIVLVGTTAPALLDLRVTPVDPAYPGVEVHANLLSGLLDGTIPIAPDYTVGYECVLLVVVGLLLAFVLPRLSALFALMMVGSVMVLVFVSNWYFYKQGFIFPIASAFLLILAVFALNMSWGYFVESRSKRHLARLFGTYVPPELVDEMARDPENYSMEARNEVLTVMFCDLKGFTTLSEQMNPLALQELLNQVLGRLSDVILQNRGTIDKYIGDAIMAFWGAPVPSKEHAELAVKTAQELQLAMAELNVQNAAKGLPEVALCIGLNTGNMCVGNMGSEKRQAYTVVGDAVNLAARLEALTRVYDLPIIASEGTRKQCQNVVWREVDKVRVKGKEKAVTIYEPMQAAQDSAAQKTELKQWAEILRAYRAGAWDTAEMGLFNAERMSKRPLHQVFVNRIRAYRQNPPPAQWDGAHNFDSK